MNSIDDFIAYAVQLLNTLNGLPALALVFVTCIAFGYFLKFVNWFPNTGIPTAVVLMGAIVYPIVADPTIEMPLHIWIIRNTLIGFITGLAAWLVHNLVIKKIETLIKGTNEQNS